jgi:hypothetical protein
MTILAPVAVECEVESRVGGGSDLRGSHPDNLDQKHAGSCRSSRRLRSGYSRHPLLSLGSFTTTLCTTGGYTESGCSPALTCGDHLDASPCASQLAALSRLGIRLAH